MGGEFGRRVYWGKVAAFTSPYRLSPMIKKNPVIFDQFTLYLGVFDKNLMTRTIGLEMALVDQNSFKCLVSVKQPKF